MRHADVTQTPVNIDLGRAPVCRGIFISRRLKKLDRTQSPLAHNWQAAAARIVAGHTRPGLPDDSYSIDWTRQYIAAFRKAATESKTSKELGDRIHGLYPNAVDVAGGFLVGVSSQVGAGEIPPWNE
jgi:hypothetical protein